MNGYVLVGGRSSRFGADDKVRAELGGRPLILHARNALPADLQRVAAVSAVGRGYEDLGFEMVWDGVDDRGPLAGIWAALTDASTDSEAHIGERASHTSWIAIVAGDLIGGDPAWWDLLLAERHRGPAVAFHDGRWHPLFALYHTSLLAEVAVRVEEGRLAVKHLLDDVAVPVAPPRHFDRLRSIDTRDALDEVRRG